MIMSDIAAAIAVLVLPGAAGGVLAYVLITAVSALRTFSRAAWARAVAEAARAVADGELKRARARSIDADTDDFIRQTAPTPATVH